MHQCPHFCLWPTSCKFNMQAGSSTTTHGEGLLIALCELLACRSLWMPRSCWTATGRGGIAVVPNSVVLASSKWASSSGHILWDVHLSLHWKIELFKWHRPSGWGVVPHMQRRPTMASRHHFVMQSRMNAFAANLYQAVYASGTNLTSAIHILVESIRWMAFDFL